MVRMLTRTLKILKVIIGDETFMATMSEHKKSSHHSGIEGRHLDQKKSLKRDGSVDRVF